jgi:16S rRNA (guanine(966)-N(2))-methyltransferase RsmD
MIRITSGKLRGVRLEAPKNDLIRPTKSSVREALFSILGHDLTGMSVCDLCAGTGAVGVEALSFGATEVTFVEKNPKVNMLLKDNLQPVRDRLSEEDVKIRVTQESFSVFLNRGFKFDLVFFDPPYKMYLRNDIFSHPFENILEENGLLVMEHCRHHPKEMPETVGSLELYRTAKYGQAFLSFYKRS